MRMGKITNLSQLVMVFVFMFFITVSQGYGDVPQEEFYMEYTEIQPQILRDAIGVLSLYLYVVDAYTLENNDYMKKFAGKISKDSFASLRTLQKESNHFRATAKVLLSELRPISGWSSTPEREMRFPILAKENHYLKIAGDARKNTGIWIDSTAPFDDFATFKELVRLREDYFLSIKKTEICVDIFKFVKSGKRKLYKAANAQAASSLIDLSTAIPGIASIFDIFESTRGALYISEIKNGFGRLCVLNYSESKLMQTIGWIKIKDEQGLLTVWPVIPLGD